MMINNKSNFTKIYDEQVSGKITGTEEYNQYIKYLAIFFQEPNNKRDRYRRETLDDKYILISKENPKKRIEITPTKFINIHRFYDELKIEMDKILLKFFSYIESKDNFTNENRADFDNIKQRYVTFKEKLNEIELINTSYFKELDKLNLEKLEKVNDLIIRYKKKTSVYSKIKTMIKQQLKTEMIKEFQKIKCQFHLIQLLKIWQKLMMFQLMILSFGLNG